MNAIAASVTFAIPGSRPMATKSAPRNDAAAGARIQSIGRARAILDVLAAANSDFVPLRDIADGSGLLKTTAFNLVTALVDTGLVERVAGRGYRLGMQALVYGRVVERRLDIVAVMRPHLVQLCAETRETVNLAIPCPTDVLIVESLEGGQGLRVSSYAGTRASYHSTACGRALMAHQHVDVRRKILSLGPLSQPTPKTCTTTSGIEAILGECRRVGFVSEVEENELGAACVGAPVYGHDGKAVAAVSVAGPLSRMGARRRGEIGRLLVMRLEEAKLNLTRQTAKAAA